MEGPPSCWNEGRHLVCEHTQLADSRRQVRARAKLLSDEGACLDRSEEDVMDRPVVSEAQAAAEGGRGRQRAAEAEVELQVCRRHAAEAYGWPVHGLCVCLAGFCGGSTWAMIGRGGGRATHLALASGSVSGRPGVGAGQRSFLLSSIFQGIWPNTADSCHQSPLHAIASHLQLSSFLL